MYPKENQLLERIFSSVNFEGMSPDEIIEKMIGFYLEEFKSDEVYDEATAFDGCGFFNGVHYALTEVNTKLVDAEEVEYYGFHTFYDDSDEYAEYAY